LKARQKEGAGVRLGNAMGQDKTESKKLIRDARRKRDLAVEPRFG